MKLVAGVLQSYQLIISGLKLDSDVLCFKPTGDITRSNNSKFQLEVFTIGIGEAIFFFLKFCMCPRMVCYLWDSTNCADTHLES